MRLGVGCDQPKFQFPDRKLAPFESGLRACAARGRSALAESVCGGRAGLEVRDGSAKLQRRALRAQGELRSQAGLKPRAGWKPALQFLRNFSAEALSC